MNVRYACGVRRSITIGEIGGCHRKRLSRTWDDADDLDVAVLQRAEHFAGSVATLSALRIMAMGKIILRERGSAVTPPPCVV